MAKTTHRTFPGIFIMLFSSLATSMVCVGETTLKTNGDPSSENTRPNILFVISDDQSFIHSSGYGCEWIQTPNFDRVAKSGIRFANAFTTSPMCSVSRASILTGRYPWQNKEGGQHYSLFPAELQVYPDILEASGYKVGYTGKGWKPGEYKIGNRKHNPAGPEYNTIKLKNIPTTGTFEVDYAANFKKFLSEKKEDQPFCFWYGSSEPHDPLEKGSGLKRGKQIDDVELGDNFYDQSDERRSHMLDYAVEVEWFDQHLGSMIDALEELGELDNTVIIVTSDNGTPMPRAKVTLYEYGTHVPFVIAWPSRVGAGLVSDELISLVDIAPTFLELAGLPPSQHMEGKSLVNLFLSGGRSPVIPHRTFVLAGQERSGHIRHDNLGYPMRSIRSAQYLFIKNYKPDRWPYGDLRTTELFPNMPWLAKNPPEEFYDPVNDPDCLNNLINDPSLKQVIEVHRSELESALVRQGDPRALGFGDVFEGYPRFGTFKENLKGFKQKGEYNPRFSGPDKAE